MKQLFFEKIGKAAKLQQESLKRKLGKAQLKISKKKQEVFLKKLLDIKMIVR